MNKLHFLLWSFSSETPSHGDGGLLGQLLTGLKHDFYLESSKDLCALVQDRVAGTISFTVITLKVVSRGTLVRKQTMTETN